MDLTIIINSYNDEKNIVGCIESAKLLTSKVAVIDMHSLDGTSEKAEKAGAKVFSFPRHDYVEPARNFAINKAKTDWVLLLDTDERLTPELASEVKSAIRNPQFSHYRIPRKNIFGGRKWLKHGGWWPDYQIRLINKNYLRTWPAQIHSTPLITGDSGLLKNPLLHFFHGDLESMVKKTIIFENIESELLYKARRPVKTGTFFRKYLGEIMRRLFGNFGFLDGEIGIIESIYQAFSKTITYIYLYEKTYLHRHGGTVRSLP